MSRRHADVGDHDGRPLYADLAEEPLRIRGTPCDHEPILGEKPAEAFADDQRVIGDDHPNLLALRQSRRVGFQFPLATGEGWRDRFDRAERRKVFGQVRDDQLEQALRPVEVLEQMFAEVAEADTGQHLVREHRLGCLRQENLAAVPRRADPRRPVDAEPDVPLRGDGWLGGVHAHPHPYGNTVRPGVGSESTLRGERRGDGILGAAEDDEEGVPLRIDLEARGALRTPSGAAVCGPRGPPRSVAPAASVTASIPRCR